MAKFVCKSCGFRTDGNRTERCPWCNREGLEKEKSAEELLDDLEE